MTELKAYTARSPAPEPSSPSASDSDSSSDSSQSEPEKGGTKERERERSQSLSRAVRRLDIDTPKSGDDNVCDSFLAHFFPVLNCFQGLW